MECWNCNDKTHLFAKCPFINYVPNKKKLIQRISMENNRKQIRNSVAVTRRHRRTIKSTTYLDASHYAAAQILIDLNFYDNNEELEERLNQIEKVR